MLDDVRNRSRRQFVTESIASGLLLTLLTQLPEQPVEATPLRKASSNGVEPINVIVRLTARADNAKQLIHHLQQILPEARQAEGCSHVSIHTRLNNPRQIILFKVWESYEAQKNYLDWEQQNGMLAALEALLDGEPSIEYWALKRT